MNCLWDNRERGEGVKGVQQNVLLLLLLLLLLRGETNVYCSEGSQAVPARPSGQGRLETRQSFEK